MIRKHWKTQNCWIFKIKSLPSWFGTSRIFSPSIKVNFSVKILLQANFRWQTASQRLSFWANFLFSQDLRGHSDRFLLRIEYLDRIIKRFISKFESYSKSANPVRLRILEELLFGRYSREHQSIFGLLGRKYNVKSCPQINNLLKKHLLLQLSNIQSHIHIQALCAPFTSAAGLHFPQVQLATY